MIKLKNTTKGLLTTFIISIIALTGCSEENTTVKESTEPDEEIVETFNETNEEPEETIQEKDIQEETTPEIFNFVDVFGEPYQVELNPNVSPNPYNSELFIKEGENYRYEDDYYTSRVGIDISKHQGYIDWEKVKNAGYDFAIIRIGYRGYGQTGSLNVDERFHQNIQSAQDAGLDIGVYFFSQAINEEEALEEANLVIENLKDYELQLPVAYDPETIRDDVARTDDVTPEQFTKNTEVFCEAIKEAGYEPMIYSNMLWQAYNLDLEYLSDYPIWYADYEPAPQTPYNFFLWQYTEKGSVDGVEGVVDINLQLIEK